MRKTMCALLAAVALTTPVVAAPAYAAPASKDQHRLLPHKGSWTRGHRLSPSDRRRAIAVVGRHHLSPPPHGYHWVRIGNDFLLVGVTSGLILKVVAAR